MNTVPLGSVSQINPKKPRDLDPETLCSFVPMEYVDDHFGTITETDTRRVKQVEKGYTYFHNWDVLFAKITPCMENGKCAIARNLVNGLGFGSTEFHVVRPKHDVMPEWIFYFLRQHSTRQEAARHMTGTAGQQRVPTRFLQEVMIPLPPLAEQKRIAAILAKADRLRRLRHTARDLSNTYLQSVFLEMFGDPVSNPMGWETHSLRSLASSIDYGVTAPASIMPVGPKFLRITDIQNGTVIWENVPYCAISEQEKQAGALQSGDIVFARTGATTGKSFLIQNCPEGAVFASYLIRVRPGERIDPFYMYGYFQSDAYWLQISGSASGSAQLGVNATKLGQLRILLPPLPLQQQFAHIVHQFERLRAQQREAQRQAEHLFQTLLHRAFRGELEDPKGLGDP